MKRKSFFFFFWGGGGGGRAKNSRAVVRGGGGGEALCHLKEKKGKKGHFKFAKKKQEVSKIGNTDTD